MWILRWKSLRILILAFNCSEGTISSTRINFFFFHKYFGNTFLVSTVIVHPPTLMGYKSFSEILTNTFNKRRYVGYFCRLSPLWPIQGNHTNTTSFSRFAQNRIVTAMIYRCIRITINYKAPHNLPDSPIYNNSMDATSAHILGMLKLLNAHGLLYVYKIYFVMKTISTTNIYFSSVLFMYLTIFMHA